MEKEQNSLSKEKYIWIFQVIFFVAIAAFAYFNYISITGTAIIFSVLLINSILFAFAFSGFKKGMDMFGEETEQKTKKIDEFDKINRQIVKRDLELARATHRLAELDLAK